MTILLDDYFYGGKIKFNMVPVRIEGTSFLLQCAEEGREYLQRWVSSDQYVNKICRR